MDIFQIIVWAAYFASLYVVIFWLLTFLEKGLSTKTKEIQKYPKVTIGIPVYNEQNNIIETIASVVNLDYPKEKLQIIVVNDGSTDNTKQIVTKYIKNNTAINIKLINKNNGGKGSALNEALKKATGEYFVCLDADSTVHPEALKKMLPHFEDSENIAVVLPLMKIKTPKTVLQKLQWCEYLLNFFYKSLMSMIDCVHVAPGPFSVYRKKVLDEIGGFALGNLTEDFEVTLKIQKKHYKIIQLLDAEVYTKCPTTFKAFCKQRNRWYKGTLLNLFEYKNMIFNRKYGDFGMLQLPRVLLSGFLAVLFIGMTGYRYIIKPLITKIHNWSSINFDFSVFISKFHWNISWIDFNYTNIFFGIVSLLLALLIINYAYTFTREKVFKQGFIAVPLYIVAYGLLASFVWLFVFIDLARGKKQRW